MHGAVIRRLSPRRGSHTRLAKLGSLACPGPSRKDDTAFRDRQAGDVSPQEGRTELGRQLWHFKHISCLSGKEGQSWSP